MASLNSVSRMLSMAVISVSSTVLNCINITAISKIQTKNREIAIVVFPFFTLLDPTDSIVFYLVHDTDLRMIVNELKNAGAISKIQTKNRVIAIVVFPFFTLSSPLLIPLLSSLLLLQ